MDRMRQVLAGWWRGPPGTPPLYGALPTHLVLVPALALSGFVAAGFALMPSVEAVGGMQKYNVELAGMTPAQRERLADWRRGLELAFWLLLAGTLLARWLRSRIGATYQLRHSSGRLISAPVGRSILEALRDAGVPHASVCGGRARRPP